MQDLKQPGQMSRRFEALIAAARHRMPLPTVVVHPCDARSLSGALDASSLGLITPIFVGPAAKMQKTAADAGRDLKVIELVDVPHSHAAADQAVALVRAGRAKALMKGSLHTDELMGPVVNTATGLRTERHVSHVYAIDVPHHSKMLYITDAALNIYPDLDAKRDIAQNAIDLVRSLGVETPKVAVLSAVETVTCKITSTIDAAALCKMADRGQISGGIIDGPLAFDNAISLEAATAKDIKSAVAGDADILLVPDLEAGNILAKQLIYLGGAGSAGIALGARVPIMLTSRADGPMERLASCALALLFNHSRERKT
ncbi:MAG: bifunctional enoyl-CoA hydratase/phosphate acetyltransferase [Hyphomicrobiaceae bacterium]